MNKNKEGKVLPIRMHIHTSTDQDDEPLTWEQEYFSRLSESTTAVVNNTAGFGRAVVALPLSNIRLSPFQTREISGDDELEELKHSILSRGVIQPIIVRRTDREDLFELVAGERRFRATALAGFNNIPALIEELGDEESVELSIIENAQRENLNPIEEANAYRLLSEKFSRTQSDIAKIVGKNRASISNSLRLLELEPEVIELLRNGELTAGHGRALLMVDSPTAQLELARRAVKKALSVRALEQIVSSDDELHETPGNETDEILERSLRRAEEKIISFLGIEKVKLSSDSSGTRRLTLSFDTEASWKRFMSKIRD